MTYICIYSALSFENDYNILGVSLLINDLNKISDPDSFYVCIRVVIILF